MIATAPVERVAVGRSAHELRQAHADRRHVLTDEELAVLAETHPSVLSGSDAHGQTALAELVKDTDLVFLMGGLGGETASSALPGLAALAAGAGAFPLGLVALPFRAEGADHQERAQKALERLASQALFTIVFENEHLLELARNLPMVRALQIMNEIMLRPLLDLKRTLVPEDLLLVRSAIGRVRRGRLGLGLGRGDAREYQAVEEAFASPWFPKELEGAEAAVVMISSSDPYAGERDKVLSAVQTKLPQARLLCGMYEDPHLKDRLRTTILLAAG